MAPLILAAYLLAIGGVGRGTGGRSGGSQSRGGDSRLMIDGGGRVRGGRKRYTRDGSKRGGGRKQQQPSTTTREGKQQQQQHDELYPLPPLTTSNGPRPTYFTCRHTYENTLIDEIKRFASSSTSYSVGGSLDTPREITATAPYPGLVRVEDNHNILPPIYDPANSHHA